MTWGRHCALFLRTANACDVITTPATAAPTPSFLPSLSRSPPLAPPPPALTLWLSYPLLHLDLHYHNIHIVKNCSVVSSLISGEPVLLLSGERTEGPCCVFTQEIVHKNITCILVSIYIYPTSLLRTLAVASSTMSDIAAKSPKDDMGSALRARM